MKASAAVPTREGSRTGIEHALSLLRPLPWRAQLGLLILTQRRSSTSSTSTMLNVSGHTFTIGSRITDSLPGPIIEAVQLTSGDIAVVWDAAAAEDRLPNLEIYSQRGERIFSAQRRVFTDGSVDPFVGVAEHDGRLYGITFGGSKIEVERQTGRLLGVTFVK